MYDQSSVSDIPSYRSVINYANRSAHNTIPEVYPL